MVGVFQLLGGRVRDFQEFGHCPLSDHFGRPWNCHGISGCVSWQVNVLQRAYDEVQAPLEVKIFPILDLIGSNQLLSCSMAMSFF